MRRQTILAGIAILAGPAWANDIFGRPDYGPLGLTRTIGYHDHQRDDGTLVVSTTSFPKQGEGFAMRIALYRAAEVAQSQGHRYLQVQLIYATLGTGTLNRGQEDARLIVRLADQPDLPIDCKQPKAHADTCRTVDGFKILTQYAQEMGKAPPAPLPVDVPSSIVVGTAAPNPGEAVTSVRFMVDAHGQPSDCAVEHSSAPDALSHTACMTIMTKGPYKAASDDAGHLVGKLHRVRLVWRIAATAGPGPATPIPAKPVADHAAKAKKVYPADDTVQTPL